MPEEDKIARMSYAELRAQIYLDSDWTKANRQAITARLGDFAWDIGATWDHVTGIDPFKGEFRRYGGTRNRASKTYIMRKAAGFSYP